MYLLKHIHITVKKNSHSDDLAKSCFSIAKEQKTTDEKLNRTQNPQGSNMITKKKKR